jgi:D-alanyl-D-alanine carboxypeptidase
MAASVRLHHPGLHDSSHRNTANTRRLYFHCGLGLERFDLPCGGQLWGHSGQLHGYVTYTDRRDDGRSLTMLLASGKDDGFISFAAATGAAYCLR